MSASVSQRMSPHSFAWSTSSFLVSGPTMIGPKRSRQLSTICSGLSTPMARSRLMIACTPGADVLPTCSATKLMRAISEPLLIHSWPVCQPSTDRSEEHTSELQSRENLVCRLLLEKKKKKNKNNAINTKKKKNKTKH